MEEWFEQEGFSQALLQVFKAKGCTSLLDVRRIAKRVYAEDLDESFNQIHVERLLEAAVEVCCEGGIRPFDTKIYADGGLPVLRACDYRVARRNE